MRRANMKLLRIILALATLGILFAMFDCAIAQKGGELSEQEAKVLSDQFLEIFNKGDLSLLDKLCTPDYTLHFVGIFPPIVGPEAVKQRVAASRTAIPDLNVKIDEKIIKGDRIIEFYTLTGTNTGPGLLPPTGKKIKVSGVRISRIVDGKFAETLVYYNFAAVLTQLGFTITPPSAQAAPAAEPEKPSRSAQAVAAYRAIGAHDPDERIRNPDYLAEKFIDSGFLETIGLSSDFELSRKLLKTSGITSFVYYYVNARTHHIDTILKKVASEGVKQVVILGAGHDSRAYRFRKVFPDVEFFEVDLPATQAQKKKRLTEIFGSPPDWVGYAPIDFNTQSLEDVLKKAGYDETQKTFFVWEGVTYYITEEGVDSTLRFIAQHSAPGSSVVFDYMHRSMIDGDLSKYPEAQWLLQRMAEQGEPLIFGIPEGKAEDFVDQRGLEVLSDLGTDELTKRYLVRSDGSIDGPTAPSAMRIMHASVPIH
jgi:methyltransferase (TIGR00027 family)